MELFLKVFRKLRFNEWLCEWLVDYFFTIYQNLLCIKQGLTLNSNWLHFEFKDLKLYTVFYQREYQGINIKFIAYKFITFSVNYFKKFYTCHFKSLFLKR